MKSLILSLAVVIALFVILWILSGLINNWLWSGDPFDEQGSLENIKKMIFEEDEEEY